MEKYAYQICQLYSTKEIKETDNSPWNIYASSHWLRPYRNLDRAIEELNALPFPGQIQRYALSHENPARRTWLTAGIAYRKVDDIPLAMHNFWPARSLAIKNLVHQQSLFYQGQAVQLRQVVDGFCFITTQENTEKKLHNHELLLGENLPWLVEDNEPIFTLKHGMEIWWRTPNDNGFHSHLGIIQSLYNHNNEVPWLPIVFNMNTQDSVFVDIIQATDSHHSHAQKTYRTIGQTHLATSAITYLSDSTKKTILPS